MSKSRGYPFADLSIEDFGKIVSRSHALRSLAALEAIRDFWRHVRWLLAPAGRPWRAMFAPRPPAPVETCGARGY